MWRASRRIVAECIRFFMSCGRSDNPEIEDLEDIPDFDVQDVPVYFQPQMFEVPVTSRQLEDLQHRPDAPYTRRRSPPEVVTKMLQAIDEMNQVKPSIVTSLGGPELPYQAEIFTSLSEDLT